VILTLANRIRAVMGLLTAALKKTAGRELFCPP
jgi:hypothetical protein